jgi:hypothetical protein
MTDRLPAPAAVAHGAATERASAAPVRRLAPLRLASGASGASGARTDLPATLAALETWMLRAITEPSSDGADRVLTSGPRLSAPERLHVYQHGYRARLVECLLDDYPVLAASLGEQRFEAIGHAYVAHNPSASPSLNAFGRKMSAFCREAEVLDPAERAFYVDLAQIEWAIVEVIHAAAALPLDAGALQGIAPEAFVAARFARSEAVRLLHLEHPANAFFQTYKSSGVVPPIPAPEPNATVVYRSGTTVWRMDLTPAMARVLGALLDGLPIGEALERMETDEADPAALAEAERSVMIWFREWVAGGMFAALSFA